MSAVNRLAMVTRRSEISSSRLNPIAASLWDVTAMLIRLNAQIKPR